MKKFLGICVLLLGLLFGVSAHGPEDIRVTVDGTFLTFDQPPVIEEGRTLVPLRAIFEAIGASVEWNDADKTAVAQKDGTEIRLTIGSNQLWKNGQTIALDVPAKIVGGRTLVPARAVSESLDASVNWDGENRIAHVESTEFSNQKWAAYGEYARIVQEKISHYGMPCVDGRTITPKGLLYGKLEDMDFNGVYELVLIGDVNDVMFFGIENGAVRELWRGEIGSRLTQTDVSPAIRWNTVNGSRVLIVDGNAGECKTGFNEKISAVTMENGRLLVNEYYGETLDWWETGVENLVYTYCEINQEPVNRDIYQSQLGNATNGAHWVWLVAGWRNGEASWFDDMDDFYGEYISYGKFTAFLNQLTSLVGVSFSA